MIKTWRGSKATVACGGPCAPSGCGATIDVALSRRHTHDGLAGIDATETVEKEGWTSDYPGWQTMLVGISHLCPACSAKAAAEQAAGGRDG